MTTSYDAAMHLDDVDLESLYDYPPTTRPWVRLNFVATVDGAAAGADGLTGGLGGEPDQRIFALLRSLADVVVVGAGTARTEGYGTVPAGAVDGALRERLGLATVPPIAVVSRSLDIPPSLLVPGQVVITVEDAPAPRLTQLRRDVDVITCGFGDVHWPGVLDEFERRGWHRVLCEGGPDLHGSLSELDLVDDLCLTVAPVLVAGNAPRIAHGPVGVTHPMRLAHHLDADDVLLTRWVRLR